MLFLIVSGSQASNWQWLRNTGLESLSEADWNILFSTLDSALDTAADGESLNWHNPESGNNGQIQLIDTPPAEERRCRRVRITTEATGTPDAEPLTFCKNPEGHWLIAPSAAATKKTN